MGRRSYDAVIVGARVAGTPTAARLAEQGWRVLLLDREPPPAGRFTPIGGFDRMAVITRPVLDPALLGVEAGQNLRDATTA